MKSRVIRKNMIKPYEQALVQAEKSAANSGEVSAERESVCRCL